MSDKRDVAIFLFVCAVTLSGVMFFHHHTETEQHMNLELGQRFDLKRAHHGVLPKNRPAIELRKVENSVTIPEPLAVSSSNPTMPMATTSPGPRCGLEVHAFYYAWYESVQFDGAWKHWRHEVLDGSKRIIEPPGDIATHFWPKLGLYSSNDPKIIRTHMKMMKESGIGVVVHSWYPRNSCDNQGGCADKITTELLDAAAENNMFVNFHIEPYQSRSPASVRDDLKYVLEKYGTHPGFYRDLDGKPWFYVYDSYLSPAYEWQQLLAPYGSFTIRDTPLDSVMIGLLVNEPEKQDLIRANFDGYFNYFAADGFTLGSTHRNFNDLAQFAQSQNKFFVPCVGPGYIDEKIRPFNTKNTHDRENGNYFLRGLNAAKNSLVNANREILNGQRSRGGVLAITSFNEWHEGTQIEPAVAMGGFMDYGGAGPEGYLNILRKFVDENWSCRNPK